MHTSELCVDPAVLVEDTRRTVLLKSVCVGFHAARIAGRPMSRRQSFLRKCWLLLVLILAVAPTAGFGIVGSSAAAEGCEPVLRVTDARAREILATERPFAPSNRDFFRNV